MLLSLENLATVTEENTKCNTASEAHIKFSPPIALGLSSSTIKFLNLVEKFDWTFHPASVDALLIEDEQKNHGAFKNWVLGLDFRVQAA